MNASRDIQIFWGEIAPAQHVCLTYEEEGPFLEILEEFVYEGLRRKEAVIVIATRAHLDRLQRKLAIRNVNLEAARASGHYHSACADETLEKFMVNGWPDETLFRQTIDSLLAPARKGGRKVRAFGEMVALLWAAGHEGATVRLEHLWKSICHQEALALFCAYPKSGFTNSASSSLAEICALHTAVLSSPMAKQKEKPVAPTSKWEFNLPILTPAQSRSQA